MLLLLLCVLGLSAGGSHPPASPCPGVFQYRRHRGVWSGVVTVPKVDRGRELSVAVSLFVFTEDNRARLHPAHINDGVGRRDETTELDLELPTQSPLPLLSRITVNNKVICQGPPVDARTTTATYFNERNSRSSYFKPAHKNPDEWSGRKARFKQTHSQLARRQNTSQTPHQRIRKENVDKANIDEEDCHANIGEEVEQESTAQKEKENVEPGEKENHPEKAMLQNKTVDREEENTTMKEDTELELGNKEDHPHKDMLQNKTMDREEENTTMKEDTELELGNKEDHPHKDMLQNKTVDREEENTTMKEDTELELGNKEDHPHKDMLQNKTKDLEGDNVDVTDEIELGRGEKEDHSDKNMLQNKTKDLEEEKENVKDGIELEPGNDANGSDKDMLLRSSTEDPHQKNEVLTDRFGFGWEPRMDDRRPDVDHDNGVLTDWKPATRNLSAMTIMTSPMPTESEKGELKVFPTPALPTAVEVLTGPEDMQNVEEAMRGVELLPRRAVAQPGDDVTFIARTGLSLRLCEFYLPGRNHKRVVFRRRNMVPANDEYEYYGSGLESGDCGITLKFVSDSLDGVIECKVTLARKVMSVSLVSVIRLTADFQEDELPSFEISPRKASVVTGEEITITCNPGPATPVEICFFYLPGSRVLDFSKGSRSIRTKEYQYSGSGLENGDCGVTLRPLDQRLTGYISCKVGSLPLDVDGAWNTDVMQLSIVDSVGLSTRILVHQPTYEHNKKVACGVPVRHAPLIYNGTLTERGEWPWLVPLYKEKNMNFICSTTLINMKHVITAAHCIKPLTTGVQFKKEELVLILGKYKVSKWAERKVQPREIERIFIHPEYNHETLMADIAVLEMNIPADYTPVVRPICLWDSDARLDRIINRTATVVGWGRTENMSMSEIPLRTNVPIVSQQECVDDNDGLRDFVNDRTLCGGYRNGSGPCTGDSGGGLLLPREKDGVTRWFLRGIVSLSLSGNRLICGLNIFTVYTDVAQYSSWLRKFNTDT